MNLTPEQELKIRLLVDGALYQQAMTFADKQREILEDGQFRHQITGLMEYAQSWRDLTQFVKHQRERDWQGRKECYGYFYTDLASYLDKLRHDVKDVYGFVPDALTKKETRKYEDFFAGLLASAFMQHLAAELLMKKEAKK